MFLRVATEASAHTSARRAVTDSDGRTPAFALSQAKLRQPASRPGIVDRPALVDRLSSPAHPAVISVVAPTGYGKTTLLSQWAATRYPDTVCTLSLEFKKVFMDEWTEAADDAHLTELARALAAVAARITPLVPAGSS